MVEDTIKETEEYLRLLEQAKKSRQCKGMTDEQIEKMVIQDMKNGRQ